MKKDIKKDTRNLKGKYNKYGKKRTNNGSKSDTSPQGIGEDTAHGYNDIAWYVSDPQILKDVASIPFSFPVGYPFMRSGKASAGLQTNQYYESVPGICAIGVTPTVGNAQTPNDAVNVAANGMYTFVRHANSGSRNYDANDLMLYCEAVDSVYTMLSLGTRIYGTLPVYHQSNKYLNDALLEAQFIDPDDFRNNMANFRMRLNMAIQKVAALAVPAVLPIFQRHSWMFSNYYIEGPSTKDQIYMYKLMTYYKFDYDSTGAGYLEAHCLSRESTQANGLLSVDDFMRVLDSMIDPIYKDEDFNIISGDIYKAYGGNILKLTPVPEQLAIGLTYDEQVLLQFKNAKCKEVLFDVTTGSSLWKNGFFNINQTIGLNSYLKVNTNQAALDCFDVIGNGAAQIVDVSTDSSTNLTMQAVYNEWTKNTLITTPAADVDPAAVMEMTRNTMSLDGHHTLNVTSNFTIDQLNFGSEWFHCANYYAFAENKQTHAMVMTHMHCDRCGVINANAVANVAYLINANWPIVSCFRYAPELSVILINGASTVYEAFRSAFEIDNYAFLTFAEVGRLHEAAVLGEYNVPKVSLSPTR